MKPLTKNPGKISNLPQHVRYRSIYLPLALGRISVQVVQLAESLAPGADLVAGAVQQESLTAQHRHPFKTLQNFDFSSPKFRKFHKFNFMNSVKSLVL